MMFRNRSATVTVCIPLNSDSLKPRAPRDRRPLSEIAAYAVLNFYLRKRGIPRILSVRNIIFCLVRYDMVEV